MLEPEVSEGELAAKLRLAEAYASPVPGTGHRGLQAAARRASAGRAASLDLPRRSASLDLARHPGSRLPAMGPQQLAPRAATEDEERSPRRLVRVNSSPPGSFPEELSLALVPITAVRSSVPAEWPADMVTRQLRPLPPRPEQHPAAQQQRSLGEPPNNAQPPQGAADPQRAEAPPGEVLPVSPTASLVRKLASLQQTLLKPRVQRAPSRPLQQEELGRVAEEEEDEGQAPRPRSPDGQQLSSSHGQLARAQLLDRQGLEAQQCRQQRELAAQQQEQMQCMAGQHLRERQRLQEHAERSIFAAGERPDTLQQPQADQHLAEQHSPFALVAAFLHSSAELAASPRFASPFASPSAQASPVGSGEQQHEPGGGPALAAQQQQQAQEPAVNSSAQMPATPDQGLPHASSPDSLSSPFDNA